eukprot:CAMPEP_0113621786 /NCGR_PEP_ID=MMETSP0017_2-20120614/11147_1 /TAXON_ID=2856 /ORGANISM="Cylindrotheca closterium" /LENGTH=262 /DNA_ID=CAMNT_0000531567 /DNA_START=230 /DNA_END=1018 /DNA_ORIENTATION=+ /assembly_acc=CAM_ASM_000147
MAFLSPRAIKNRLQKVKLGRTKSPGSGVNKPTLDSSQHTFRGDSDGSLRSSSNALESKPDLVQPSVYGYEDAAPDTAVKNMANVSRDPYGYELHDPSPAAAPRRSSMKGSNPEPRPTRRRHSISFDKEVKVNKVVPTTTMVKDKGDMWLQGEDYYKIINKVNTIVDRTTSGSGQKYCVRGLEHMIQTREDPSEPRTEAWDAVLGEQQIQQATGGYDEEVLSRKYRSCSSQSRMKAKVRAMKDERDVSSYLEDTRRDYRRMSM